MVFFIKKVNSIMRNILSMSYVKEFFGNRWLYWVKPKKILKNPKKTYKIPIAKNPIAKKSQSPIAKPILGSEQVLGTRIATGLKSEFSLNNLEKSI